MPSFDKILDDLRAVHTEILRIAPYRDLGLVPNPPAHPRNIAAAELRLGRRLPPSYRGFLDRSNGWPRFFDGASLLGTADLGRRSYDAIIRAVFDSADTPVPDLGPPSTARAPVALLPFGIDAQATTLFAFDTSAVHASGEMDVIAWINEIGVRRESFVDFLDMVLEIACSEFETLVDRPLARSA